MTKISSADRKLLSQLARLTYCNPFSQERIELEKSVLGKDFVADESIAWSRGLENKSTDRPNVPKVNAVAERLVEKFLQSEDRDDYSDAVLEEYWDVSTYVLLYNHLVGYETEIFRQPKTTTRIFRAFLKDYERMSALPGIDKKSIQSPGHLFACLCQVRHAFLNIYDYILGDSLPAVELRRAVWESIFSNDLRRYRRSLFHRMGNLPTLITGPSGTGKELVARAIGMSQYLPFDEKSQTFADPDDLFHALNLSAMSPTLVESELFGHCKGAFTGAVGERKGWLQKCKPHGAVFLDEIGEMDPALQVKLLRVVQQRNYVRVGESKERAFTGKLIGATNRDMAVEMQAGRFREDLYYRLCADRIETPGLREQLDHRPADLGSLTLYISRRLVGEEGSEAEALRDEAVQWIESNLGPAYPWRGNIRELEQCVSSIVIRGKYVPSISLCDSSGSNASGAAGWTQAMIAGKLTADEVLQRYCTWIYAKTGSYEATARQIGLDRRTVKSRVDENLLAKIKAAAG